MSKVDAQRAMREAKFARNSARAEPVSTEKTTVPTDPSKPAKTPRVRATKAVPAATAPQGELCGHKSMNGRACTREVAHSEKSHRYS